MTDTYTQTHTLARKPSSYFLLFTRLIVFFSSFVFVCLSCLVVLFLQFLLYGHCPVDKNFTAIEKMSLSLSSLIVFPLSSSSSSSLYFCFTLFEFIISFILIFNLTWYQYFLRPFKIFTFTFRCEWIFESCEFVKINIKINKNRRKTFLSFAFSVSVSVRVCVTVTVCEC